MQTWGQIRNPGAMIASMPKLTEGDALHHPGALRILLPHTHGGEQAEELSLSHGRCCFRHHHSLIKELP